VKAESNEELSSCELTEINNVIAVRVRRRIKTTNLEQEKRE